MHQRPWAVTAVALVCLVLLAAPAMAQPAARGNLVVQVVSQKGEPVSGAQVRLMGPFRERDHTTAYDGIARFPLLKDGVYELQVVAKGLERLIHPDITIRGGQTLELRLVMRGQIP
ncbi:MAG: carboxypeptidase-like regulatory domain-containing protein [Desulfarculaceae bacterium]|nr:carboxypeptidase-like regulatory domain-containing protein [Desulfarculaceae bacterium]MCF8073660.1 carboxypeptidase-like regulatory domain-containing protein [Desulfarculaceae bacterium]MCF8103108.1 carboxypeptidase-like regulatory domain-containing protein [Desulfarculaceae bacterium]MCF8118517.1 carboxypeptidase-like regulatory domain-containing protein [Desulfarculaceae bacterium]